MTGIGGNATVERPVRIIRSIQGEEAKTKWKAAKLEFKSKGHAEPVCRRD